MHQSSWFRVSSAARRYLAISCSLVSAVVLRSHDFASPSVGGLRYSCVKAVPKDPIRQQPTRGTQRAALFCRRRGFSSSVGSEPAGWMSHIRHSEAAFATWYAGSSVPADPTCGEPDPAAVSPSAVSPRSRGVRVSRGRKSMPLASRGDRDRAVERPRFSGYPFTLGVASGAPLPDGVVLWTRLAPRPLERRRRGA